MSLQNIKNQKHNRIPKNLDVKYVLIIVVYFIRQEIFKKYQNLFGNLFNKQSLILLYYETLKQSLYHKFSLNP